MQGRVQIAFLDQFRGLAEGRIIGAGEVTIGKPGSRENRARVELGAGRLRSDRDALALQIGEGFDPRCRVGDELHVIAIDRGDAAQLGEWAAESRFRVALQRSR